MCLLQFYRLFLQKFPHSSYNVKQIWSQNRILYPNWWHIHCIPNEDMNQSFTYENHCECYDHSHQDRGRRYLHLPNFFPCIHSPPLLKNEKLLWLLFFSNSDYRPLFSDIYYKTILMWGIVSKWLTNATHSL